METTEERRQKKLEVKGNEAIRRKVEGGDRMEKEGRRQKGKGRDSEACSYPLKDGGNVNRNNRPGDLSSRKSGNYAINSSVFLFFYFLILCSFF